VHAGRRRILSVVNGQRERDRTQELVGQVKGIQTDVKCVNGAKINFRKVKKGNKQSKEKRVTAHSSSRRKTKKGPRKKGLVWRYSIDGSKSKMGGD